MSLISPCDISIDAVYGRIQTILGVRTQVELAAVLGVRQSSVSDALKRGNIPDSWLLTMMTAKGVNPLWIKTGRGHQYVQETDDTPAKLALFRAAINALMAERRALRSFAAALGIRSQVPRSRRLELSQEHLRMEGLARRACKAAGFELRNNDQPLETV